jgi:uncharacterized membrane protein
MSTGRTAEAIEAFRKMERASLNVETAEFALQRILARGDIDMDDYVRSTEAIRASFEQKREALARVGRLSK